MCERHSKRPRLTEQQRIEEVLRIPSEIKDQDAFQSQFARIARESLQSSLILTDATSEASETYRILELEVYLSSPTHPDPYCHAHPDQLTSGLFYFHRATKPVTSTIRAGRETRATGYRGGTRKGLDITFGDGQDARSGILLRTVQRISDGQLVSGPSKLVDEVLRFFRAQSIRELVEDKWQGDVSASPSETRPCCMRLQLADSNQPVEMYSSPRVGLDLASLKDKSATLEHPRLIYLARPYRFFTEPQKLNKNGLANTFVCFYESEKSLDQASKIQHVCQVTSMKQASAKQLAEVYESAKDTADYTSFIGRKTVGNTAELVKLFGTLRGALRLLLRPK